uniref:Uncharacterized protein n=1 Tax=Meloidogyne enterolobii TaxID=390850 RepID=A0A6V7VQ73_MELEN|nr:unnamed protein product [Meloidogyne enterolobii]
MLFCLLHPMDHNTGPLARKSSMLCVLLLISIAAFLVIAVPGQANAEEVGVANHIKDEDGVTLEGDSKLANTSLRYDYYKERFPNVCEFEIAAPHIKIRYNGEKCTVELITKEKMEMIKFTTGMEGNNFTCLEDCKGGRHHIHDGFSNLLPFAYSINNEELGKISANPNYDTETVCVKKESCGGECMKETFLEVSWSKCVGYVYAHTHLIGEAARGLDKFKKNDSKEFKVNLEISDGSFKMEFNEDKKNIFETTKDNTLCLPSTSDALIKPKAWKIKNGVRDLEGKYLLVFHLLPQNATRMYNEDGKVLELPGGPNCDLFIQFERGPYQFLRVDPKKSTTVTTTTTTTEPTTATNKTIPTTGTQQVNSTPTARVQEVKDTEKKSYGWVLVILFLLVAAGIGIGFYVWHSKSKKAKQQEEEIEEVNEEGCDEEGELQTAYWANIGNEDAINEANFKRKIAKLPSLEDQYVREIYDRMNKHKAAVHKKLLFEVYLPELQEKGYPIVGTYREWRKKTGFNVKPGESRDMREGRIQKAAEQKKEKEAAKKYFDEKQSKDYYDENTKGGGEKIVQGEVEEFEPKVDWTKKDSILKESTSKHSDAKKESTSKHSDAKKESTSKHSTLKTDPAPEKADAVKSKQANTASSIPAEKSAVGETDQ